MAVTVRCPGCEKLFAVNKAESLDQFFNCSSCGAPFIPSENLVSNYRAAAAPTAAAPAARRRARSHPASGCLGAISYAIAVIAVGLFAAAAFAVGVLHFIRAKSIMHEIQGAIFFLIGVAIVSTGLLLDAIGRLIRAVEKIDRSER